MTTDTLTLLWEEAQQNWAAIDLALSQRLVEMGELRPGESLLQGIDPEPEFSRTGQYGTVYLTNHPDWVLKLTTDKTETPTFEAIRTDPYLSASLGVVDVGGVWRLPSGVGVILREAIQPISSVSSYQWATLPSSLQQLFETSMAAEYLNEHKTQANRTEFQDELVRLEDHHEMRYLADFMGVMFETTGVALDDIHPGNLGRRPNDRALVAFDLGGTVGAEAVVPSLPLV